MLGTKIRSFPSLIGRSMVADEVQNSGKMRVAFLTNYHLLYGANRSLLSLISELQAYGVTPIVIVPQEGEFTAVLAKEHVQHYIVPYKMWMHTPRTYEGNLVAKMGQYFHYTREDTLHRLLTIFHSVKTLARELKEIDIFYSNTSSICVGILLAKFLRRPHVWHLREFGQLDYNLYFDLGDYLSRRIIKSSSAVIAISKAIQSHFFGGNDLDSKVSIIYNGVAPRATFNDLYVRAKHRKGQKDKSAFTFAIVGVLQPGKRQDEAIRAFKIVHDCFPDSRLLIAGTARNIREEQQLRDLVSELNIGDSVEFCGFIQDPFEVFLNADASLMCSRNEGMGRVTVESMAACCPVIGYNNAGTAEVITHEVTGLLYEGGHQELASNMIRLVEDSALAEQLSENAWRDAREKYCTEQYARQVYDVLCRIT